MRGQHAMPAQRRRTRSILPQTDQPNRESRFRPELRYDYDQSLSEESGAAIPVHNVAPSRSWLRKRGNISACRCTTPCLTSSAEAIGSHCSSSNSALGSSSPWAYQSAGPHCGPFLCRRSHDTKSRRRIVRIGLLGNSGRTRGPDMKTCRDRRKAHFAIPS